MSTEHVMSGMAESARDAVSQAKTTMGDVAARVQSKAADLGHAAGEKLEAGRGMAADRLDGAAAGLHKGADRMSEMGHQAADGIGATATYLRDHGTREMMGDVEKLVRTHPGKSLLAAVAVGFLTARALRHD